MRDEDLAEAAVIGRAPVLVFEHDHLAVLGRILENAHASALSRDDRLAGLLCASRDLPAQEIADAILADVTLFQGDHDRFDDETIIVLCVR